MAISTSTMRPMPGDTRELGAWLDQHLLQMPMDADAAGLAPDVTVLLGVQTARVLEAGFASVAPDELKPLAAALRGDLRLLGHLQTLLLARGGAYWQRQLAATDANDSDFTVVKDHVERLLYERITGARPRAPRAGATPSKPPRRRLAGLALGLVGLVIALGIAAAGVQWYHGQIVEDLDRKLSEASKKAEELADSGARASAAELALQQSQETLRQRDEEWKKKLQDADSRAGPLAKQLEVATAQNAALQQSQEMLRQRDEEWKKKLQDADSRTGPLAKQLEIVTAQNAALKTEIARLKGATTPGIFVHSEVRDIKAGTKDSIPFKAPINAFGSSKFVFIIAGMGKLVEKRPDDGVSTGMTDLELRVYEENKNVPLAQDKLGYLDRRRLELRLTPGGEYRIEVSSQSSMTANRYILLVHEEKPK